MQIPHIPDIYRLSDSVAVCLRETISYGKVAFSFATWITKHPDLVAKIAKDQLEVLITAFFDMIRNPWFRRKWVIADFVLAKEVNLHYGKDVLPWKVMAGAIYVLRYRALEIFQLFLQKYKHANSFLDFLADFRYQGINEFVDLRDDMQRKLSNPLSIDPRIRLDGLVTRTALLNATISHDTVYSMMFLVSQRRTLRRDLEEKSSVLAASKPETPLGPRPYMTWLSSLDSQLLFRAPLLLEPFAPLRGLQVGYGLSAQNVYCEFVRRTICSTRQLDIICRPWAPEVPDLPSWVRPRSEHAFRVSDDNRYRRMNADGLAVSTSTDQTLYSACGKNCLIDERKASVAVGVESFLLVEGFELGLVHVVAPHALNGILPKEWREIGDGSNKSRVSDDRFWRTLVADRDSTGLACPAWYELASEHILRNTGGIDLDTRRLMFESSPGIVFGFLGRVQSVIWGRRLGTLDQGSVVLAPGSCEVGDLVAILHGCSVPVLLRPSSKSRCYTVVGECYVHGMMDGEARMLEEQGKLHNKPFVLY